ncbi:MAG TPA: DMT family transporter [Longilinea sp.]|nr:DMT family transporter [Longilinea sp.]
MPDILKTKGLKAAISSALLLGLAPVFGKQAILLGFSPLAVVAFRTTGAVLLLMIPLLLFNRKYFYIYPVGLIGCVVAGVINGIGSILYYTALSHLDASIGQLLYSFYPLFVAFWLLLDRHPLSRLTIFRLGLALPGIYLLLQTGGAHVDIEGAVMMLGAAILYALHLIINQRILYEVPAPTVAFYTLSAMAITVTAAYLIFNPQIPSTDITWWPILAMALITFLSRLALFQGVKHLGGLQTAILGLGELIITVVLSYFWLGDRLSLIQWIGAGLLSASLFLVGYDKLTPDKRKTTGMLAWLNPPKINPTDYPGQQ